MAETYTIERRLALGGTDYAERLMHALVKYPGITEVLTTEVVSAGKAGNYAVDLRIVYRAERHLSWNELLTAARHVPLYDDVDPETMRAVLAREQKGLDHG